MDSIRNNDLVLAAVLTAVIFCVLIAFSIAYVMIYQRKRKEHRDEMNAFKKKFEEQLLQSTVEVQEQAFQQIGRELHDNVGQLLSTAKMLLGLTERKLTPVPDTLLTANATLGQAISELRSLSRMLDREWLEQFSFKINLAAQIDRINAAGSIRMEFHGEDLHDLSSDKQIILFRIVQEAIQNAVRHGAASSIHVNAIEESGRYVLEINDDGEGFDVQAKSTGMGLANMQQRVKLLGGSIEWRSSPDTGTRVNIIIPTKKLSHEEINRFSR